MPKIMYLTNLRTSVLDDTCARRLWFERFEGGTGAVPRKEIVPAAILEETQRDFWGLQYLSEEDLKVENLRKEVQAILGGLTPEDLSNIPHMELLYRRLGWYVSYAIFVEPVLRHVYDTMPIPQELILDRDPLQVSLFPGRLVQDRANRDVVYRVYVPSYNVSHNWRESWKTSILPQVELCAVAEALDVNVDYFQVVGLHKGFVSKVGEGSLSHPYVQAYHNTLTGEWTHNFLVGKGEEWEETFVWNYPGGLVDWVLKCGREVADRQFPLSPRIPCNPGMVQDWVQRRLGRERMMGSATGNAVNNEWHRGQHFPRNTQSCKPLVGEECPFILSCWSEEVLKSPLSLKEFVPNTGMELLGRHTIEPEVERALVY